MIALRILRGGLLGTVAFLLWVTLCVNKRHPRRYEHWTFRFLSWCDETDPRCYCRECRLRDKPGGTP